MPFLMLCYVAAYLDRVNVGSAKLQMLGDLGFSEAVYGLGAGILFVGYFLFEVPSNLYLDKVGVRATLCRIMVLWGCYRRASRSSRPLPRFTYCGFCYAPLKQGSTPG